MSPRAAARRRRTLHALLKRGYAHASDVEVHRCVKGKEAWQVGMSLEVDNKPLGERYFIVSWRPPQHFELVAVDTQPRADCAGAPPGEREFASR